MRFEGYSLIRAGPTEQHRGDDGSMGPLLRQGARLDMRWQVDAKKTRGGRPFTAESSIGKENGSVRFSACGVEVGKFPAAAARTLVPLLARRLVDAEAFVGSHPPRELELGTNVPVVVQVSLRSAALSTPGKTANKAVAATALGGASAGTGAAAPAKKRAKAKPTANGLKEEEADREVTKNAMAQLLEQLNLPKRREAAAGDAAAGASGGGDAAAPGDAAGGAAEALGDAEPDLGAGNGEEEAEAQDEMTVEAGAQLGGRAALERSDLPAMELPEDLFAARLRLYQAQAVYWMWQRENPTTELPSGWLRGAQEAAAAAAHPAQASGRASPLQAPANGDSERPLHPMWDEYVLKSPMELPGRRGPVQFIYHHRTSGALSLDFPDAALAHCRGGILADDMGLGKTVMCLALLALDLPPELPSARQAAPALRALEGEAPAAQREMTSFLQSGVDDTVGGTLVVVPLSLLTQWRAEAERHYPPARRPQVHEYHGGGRHQTPQQLRAMDLVLTTYNTLAGEPDDGPLFQVYWRRIILDEAHSIKNRGSRMAQAAFRLRSFCRWCVTGTPLQNSIDELYALVKFLRVDPWSAWPEWRNAVSLPLERGRKGDSKAMNAAMDMARRVAQPLLLRRTKTTKDPVTGELLLKLPPKHVHVLNLQLSPPERDFYDALYKKAKTQFDTFVASGEALTKYTHILQLILKLRQALCHPFLVFARDGATDTDFERLEQRCLSEMSRDGGKSQKFVANLLEELRQGALPDCPICVDTPEDPAMTPCGHIFCRDCAIKAIDACKGECPVCRQPGALSRKSLRVLPGASRFPSRLLARASGGEGDKGGGSEAAHSTKMRELMRLLREDMEAGRRAVVFSQWTSFLDLVGAAVDAAEIPAKRFDGKLSREERQARVEWLSEEVPEESCGGPGSGRALLVSLKAGGVGLNLVAATRLYLLDLWWNPAVEEQAIQRVHRIGQTSEVHVYKFVVSDSIDTDLLDLQGAKGRLLEDALESGGSREGASKLSMDDIKRLFNPCRSSLKGLQGGSEASATTAAPPAPAAPVEAEEVPEAPPQPQSPPQAQAPPQPQAQAPPHLRAPLAPAHAPSPWAPAPPRAGFSQRRLQDPVQPASAVGADHAANPAEATAMPVAAPASRDGEEAGGEDLAQTLDAMILAGVRASDGAVAGAGPVVKDEIEDDEDDDLLLEACQACESQLATERFGQAASGLAGLPPRQPPPLPPPASPPRFAPSAIGAGFRGAAPAPPGFDFGDAGPGGGASGSSAPPPGLGPQCRCSPPKQPMLLTVRKEGPNLGRQFYKCPECNFFEWAAPGAAAASAAPGPAPSGFGGGGPGFGAGPSSGGGAGGAGSCFKCGQTGHWARDCPSAGGAGPGGGGAFGGASFGGGRSQGGRGGGGGGGGECFRCGQVGHWAGSCPNR